jgi:hypothetical protein
MKRIALVVLLLCFACKSASSSSWSRLRFALSGAVCGGSTGLRPRGEEKRSVRHQLSFQT